MSFGGEDLVQNNQSAGSMRLGAYDDGTAVYKPMMPLNNSNGNENSNQFESNFMPTPMLHQPVEEGIHMATVNDGESNLEPVMRMRKRGRPRKYVAEEAIASPQQHGSPVAAASGSSGGGGGASSFVKRSRGRPLGSLKKNKLAVPGVAVGSGFVPIVITVNAGEDVLSRMALFPQILQGSFCFLTANGSISNVKIRPAAPGAMPVTYEGRYEILSLGGSFHFAEIDGKRSRVGSLTIVVAGSDGRVMGGNLESDLTAASPVQVVVGCYTLEETKVSKLENNSDGLSAPQGPDSELHTATSQFSHGTLSESSGGPVSPHNLGLPIYNSNPQGIPNFSWG